MIMEKNGSFEKVILAHAECSPGQNERFWKAHAEYKSQLAAWEADPDKSNDGNDRWFAAIQPLLERMMTIPVDSACAVLAKFMAVEGQEIDLPAPVMSSLSMMEWDLERVAKKEMSGDAGGGPRQAV